MQLTAVGATGRIWISGMDAETVGVHSGPTQCPAGPFCPAEPASSDHDQHDEDSVLETAFAGGADEFEAPDMLLEFLVYGADASAMSMGPTLTVGGVLVGGTLIGRPEYDKLLVRTLQPASASFAKAMETLLAEGARHREARLATREAAGLQPPMTRFIHLHDAHVITGEAWVPAALWRGRLESVDGWTPGFLGREEKPWSAA